jgi:hypothetical protein
MNLNLNMEDILYKINEIETLINTKKIKNIEKDILLGKVRFLYEIILIKNTENIIFKSGTIENKTDKTEIENVILKKVESITNNKIEIEENEEIVFSDPEIEFVKSTDSEEIAENRTPNIDENLNQIKNTNHISEEIKNNIVEPTLFDNDNQTNENTVNSEKTKSEITETKTQTISDQFIKASGKTLSDVISKPSNATYIQAKPVKNLKSAININDRIMFTKELFNNNNDYFNEVMEKINNMNNFSDANQYFLTQIENNENTDSIEKFVDIIHRRFPE